MRMILRLFVMSRGTVGAFAIIVVSNLLGMFIVSANIERAGSDGAIPWLLFLPFLSACVIGLSMRSPMDDFERLGARSLVAWRLAHIGTLLLPALLLLVFVTRGLAGASTEFSAVRNLIGLVGLTLVTGRVAGARLSWLPGLLWCMAAASLGDPRSTSPAWDWLVRSDSSYQAAVVAWALGLLGVIAAATGSREFRWSSVDPDGSR